MPAIQEQIEVLRKKLAARLALQDLGEDHSQEIAEINFQLQSIQTGGGAVVAGNVNTGGGDFTGRDRIEILNARVVSFQKDAEGNIVIVGDNNRVTVSAQDAPALMLRRYTIALARECQKLPLGLLGEQFAVPGAEQKITLKNVYTDLDVTAPPRPEDSGDERQMRLWGLRLSQGEGSQRTPVLKAMGEPTARKLILLGEAGSGKTTFVNFIASALAGASEEEEIPEVLRGLIPIRVILRQAARQLEPGQEQGKAGLLWQAVHVEMSDILGKATADQLLPYLQEQVERRGALVLLDGLDEVPEANQRRRCLLESIQEWSETLPEQTRFLLTARPYAYVGAFRLPEFQEVALAPFSQEQAENFIAQWYRAVRAAQSWEEEKANEKTSQLIEAMRERPQLADLASRPLLLTLMATLHTHRGRLPDNRADLYEGSVVLLLDRWQTQRQVRGLIEPGIERALGLGETVLRRAVETLAYETHVRQGAEVSEREGEAARQAADIPYEQIVTIFLPLLPPGADVRDLVKYLEERAGLLIARKEGMYAFLHRSFQEYLTACHLSYIRSDFDKALKEKLQEDLDWWREVFLLSVGRENFSRISNAVQLLHYLIPKDPGTSNSDLDYRLAMLGAQAALELRLLETAPKNDAYYDELLKRLRGWLTHLVEQGKLPAIERLRAANSLGKLGDPRFDETRWHLPALLRGQPEPLLGFVKIWGGKMPDFWMGRYPVTNAQYRDFIEADGYNSEKYWTPAGWAWRNGKEPDQSMLDGYMESAQKRIRERARSKPSQPAYWNDPQWAALTRPVVGVSWYEAMAYCQWLDEQLRASQPDLFPHNHYVLRLPTEAEWMQAASGNKREWAWGNEWQDDHANTDKANLRQTSPVGMFPLGKTPETGLLDITGNVWEWSADWYEKGKYRSLRGGSWYDSGRYARCALRDRNLPGNFDFDFGFRWSVSLAISDS